MKQPLVCGSCGGNTFVLEAEDNDLAVCANHRCGQTLRTIRPYDGSSRGVEKLGNHSHVLYIRLLSEDYQAIVLSGMETMLFQAVQKLTEDMVAQAKTTPSGWHTPLSLPQGRIGQGQGGTP